ncbi:hypothetical protein FQN51_007307 [Onygenales sp. PD_10]|nr:hypothetical protein FQN51_007307 [Onygenales sp. PD_10]
MGSSWTFSPRDAGPSEYIEQSPALQMPYEIPLYANAVYYPNWRVYGKQPPSSLRLGFVSHILYSFAWVKPDGTIYLSDEWADERMPVDGAEGCLRAFVQLKQQYSTMKVLLSIGGGGKGSENFSSVAHDSEKVEKFVQSAKDLADQFGLDGFDINWEHPTNTQEGHDYVCLLSRLRQQFPSPHYLLTTALPAGEWALRNINLAWAQTYLDLIHLMTYDFSGPWLPLTGHQSQLYTPTAPHNDAACISCHSGVSYTLTQGVPSKKILLGIPVYGRSFPGASGINQPYEGAGGDEKVFDYRELPRPGTKECHDEAVGAAFCVDEQAGFVSYDSTRTVREKARFVSEMKLGGLFYWHVAADAVGERSLVATGYNTLHDL